MRDAIDSGACDMVGVARSAIIVPELPRLILNENIPDAGATCGPYAVTGGGVIRLLPFKAVGAGLSSVRLLVRLTIPPVLLITADDISKIQLWHSLQIHRFGRGLEPDPALSIEELKKF